MRGNGPRLAPGLIMPNDHDRIYYTERSERALTSAQRAACDKSREAHTEMARLYQGLAQGFWKLPSVMSNEA
jgi:hypothetical protein